MGRSLHEEDPKFLIITRSLFIFKIIIKNPDI
jgi:hypothetical protein